MKEYTSKFLKCVALFYLAFPVTYLAAAGVLFDIAPANLGRVMLTAFFWLLSALAIVTGYGLWEMRRWAWYFLFAVNVLVAYENASLVHNYAETHHRILSYIASLLMMAWGMHRISSEVRVPYFFPKIRWWENNPRYKLSVPVKVVRPSVAKLGEPGPQIEAEILDLSMGGCFIKLRSDLGQGEVVALSFKVFGIPVDCEGTVVWRTQSRVTHPRGVGVKFSITTRAQKRALRQIYARLRKIAQHYRRSRYLMPQDEFMKRLDELERRGAQDSA